MSILLHQYDSLSMNLFSLPAAILSPHYLVVRFLTFVFSLYKYYALATFLFFRYLIICALL
jgi:hypothetical protein